MKNDPEKWHGKKIRDMVPEKTRDEKTLELCKEAIQEWRDGKRNDKDLAMLMHVILSEQKPPSEKMIEIAHKLADEI